MKTLLFLAFIVSPLQAQVFFPAIPVSVASGGGGCGSTVVHNNTSTAGRQTGVSSQTWSLTVNSGTCLLLVVGIAHSGAFDGTSVSSVAFNTSESLTYLTGSRVTNGAMTVEYWYKKSPTVTTANVVVTMSNTTSVITSGAEVVDDANQTSTFGTPVTATGNSVAPAVTCTSATGDLVFGLAGVDNAGTRTLSVNLGTQRWITSASSAQESGGSTRAGATPALSWTIDVGDVWAASSVSIHHN